MNQSLQTRCVPVNAKQQTFANNRYMYRYFKTEQTQTKYLCSHPKALPASHVAQLGHTDP